MSGAEFREQKFRAFLPEERICELQGVKNGSQLREWSSSSDTVIANHVQFWFRRIGSGIFDVKDGPRTGRPIVKNVDKITEIVDRLVSSPSIAQ
ncbi:hypothetical protein NPIL_515871 [Nephila pilipes]|uniref:Uncharacterized protein n=1 Tax=Nephila pilipes TaxID=299642 RepID=A0A8X6TEI4_NEPPI|nr:hypothetical protein NPIL_515871 [Nephila pilipes]